MLCLFTPTNNPRHHLWHPNLRVNVKVERTIKNDIKKLKGFANCLKHFKEADVLSKWESGQG